MGRLPAGTVTLLFTDIESSTELLHELGDGYAAVLAAHRRAVRAAIGAHRGAEVDTQGDAFFAVFANATDAVDAALDAQRALAGSPVRVRMGMHTGVPTVTDEGYVGLDVHRGARICAAGHGGQILVSHATRELLPPRVESLDLGEHRLKDLRTPEWLFQILAPDLNAHFPPLRSLNNTNLPAETTPVIGRSLELAELADLIGRSDVRLVTLTGPGGTGKTRLAIQLATQLVEVFPNGVFLVTLATLTDAALVLPTIARSLGVKERSGEDLAERVRHHVGRKKLLLVLDNFEHLLPGAGIVSDLLESGAQLKVLVTSRERLRIRGEHEYPVSPLSAEAAVTLFDERARAAVPSFVLSTNDATVRKICARLDNLPLAVELAAARVRIFGLADLLARLDRRLSVLVGGARPACAAANAVGDDRMELRIAERGRARHVRRVERVQWWVHA